MIFSAHYNYYSVAQLFLLPADLRGFESFLNSGNELPAFEIRNNSRSLGQAEFLCVDHFYDGAPGMIFPC
jgi:hypothetical protein